MPALAIAALTGSDVEGSTSAAAAETAASEPASPDVEETLSAPPPTATTASGEAAIQSSNTAGHAFAILGGVALAALGGLESRFETWVRRLQSSVATPTVQEQS